MAKIYSPDAEFYFDYSKGDRFSDVADAYIKDLSGVCKAHSSHEFAGEVIRFPVADGYAEYMVFEVDGNDVILYHLPIGDAYRAHSLIEKGVDLEYLKENISQRKALFV